MTQLVLHTTSAADVARAIAHPPHALLITGLTGMGKEGVAREIAAQVLGLDTVALDNSVQFLDVRPEKGEAFGIDTVRNIRHFMTLRSTSAKPGAIVRIAVLSNAHTMTKEAQNALLKLLEEPPADSMLILTATSEQALLPTIVSRSQVLPLVKPERDVLAKHFVALGKSSDDVELVLRISGGLPGLAASMLNEAQEHPLARAATTARSLVQQTAFERLCTVESLAKEREFCLDLCSILQQMAHLALQQASSATTARWQRILESAYDCQIALERRVNTKLAMTRLMLSL
jgi:DNA polymerase-3 subunit delta'